MTFSIAAAGPHGQLGIAVASRVLGVGGRCAYIVPGRVAVCSQAYVNPYLAVDIGAAADARAAARAALASDPAREWRQLIALTSRGETFAHTGASTDPWAGHRVGAGCIAAGNLLTGGAVVDALVETFAACDNEPLPERLMRALEAGQAAGGDRRGQQSAALLVHGPLEPAYVDLRVDDHATPVAELRRLWELARGPALERAWRVASTREPEPVAALLERQAGVIAQLEATGGT
jgi:uncharacterized Ntn-hydrolase superfamily protein